MALRYLIDTPVIGTRASGDPGSNDWWLTPGESSLDYRNIEALLMQLAEWMERGDPALVPPTSPVGTTDSRSSMSRPPKSVERFLIKWKKHWFVAGVPLAVIAIGTLAASLESIASIVSRILSAF